MDLFFEKPEQTEAVLLATELKMEDPENFIYTINGVDAYGISDKNSNFVQILIQLVNYPFLRRCHYDFAMLSFSRDVQCCTSFGHWSFHTTEPDYSAVCSTGLHSKERNVQGISEFDLKETRKIHNL